MNKYVLMVLCLGFALGPGSAMAVGLGPYFGYERGSITLSEADSSVEYDLDADHFAFGFLLDTAPAQDKLFNYRLNIGMDIPTFKETPWEYSGYGFDMKHTFGFGFVRNSAVRVWAGPTIKIYMDSVSAEGSDSFYVIGSGGGPELGVNINISGFMSIGIAGGYSFNYVIATGDTIGDTLYGPEHMFYVQVAPIFHIGSDKDAW